MEDLFAPFPDQISVRIPAITPSGIGSALLLIAPQLTSSCR
jgi:hypothetical protein